MPSDSHLRPDAGTAPAWAVSPGALDAACDALQVGVGLIGADGRFIQVNPAFARLHGVVPADMAGRETTLVLPEPGEGPGADRRILRPDGGMVDVWVTAARLAEGPWAGATAVTLLDVTARRQAEAELRVALSRAEEARTAQSALWAAMGEELRVPLNAVMAFSEILVKEALGPIEPAAYHDYADDLHASGRLLMDLLGDMLDIAALESRGMEMDESDLDLAELLAAYEGTLRAAYPATAFRYETAVDWPVGVVRFDPELLKRLLGLTLGVLAQEMPADGRVRIGAFPLPDGRCHIALTHGGTVPTSRRMGDIMGRRPGGLALPMARAIVEATGGRLVVNTAPGAGTGIAILLPIRRVRRRRLIAVPCVLRACNRAVPIACGHVDARQLDRLPDAAYRLDSSGVILEVRPHGEARPRAVREEAGDPHAIALAGRDLFDDVAPSLRATPLVDRLHEGIVEGDLDIQLVVPADDGTRRMVHLDIRRADAPEQAWMFVRRV